MQQRGQQQSRNPEQDWQELGELTAKGSGGGFVVKVKSNSDYLAICQNAENDHCFALWTHTLSDKRQH